MTLSLFGLQNCCFNIFSAQIPFHDVILSYLDVPICNMWFTCFSLVLSQQHVETILTGFGRAPKAPEGSQRPLSAWKTLTSGLRPGQLSYGSGWLKTSHVLFCLKLPWVENNQIQADSAGTNKIGCCPITCWGSTSPKTTLNCPQAQPQMILDRMCSKLNTQVCFEG